MCEPNLFTLYSPQFVVHAYNTIKVLSFWFFVPKIDVVGLKCQSILGKPFHNHYLFQDPNYLSKHLNHAISTSTVSDLEPYNPGDSLPQVIYLFYYYTSLIHKLD